MFIPEVEVKAMQTNNHDIVGFVLLMKDMQNEMLKSESARLRTGLTAANKKLFMGQIECLAKRVSQVEPVDLPTTHADTTFTVGETVGENINIGDI